jgi:hypothetical protein
MHLLSTGNYIEEYTFCHLTAKYTKFSQNSDKNAKNVAKTAVKRVRNRKYDWKIG